MNQSHLKLASLWIGDKLGELEIACLNSLISAGNEIVIFSYNKIYNLPFGAKSCNANTIFDGSKIYRYKFNQSPALHANIFRYHLMLKTELIWVDLDFIFLKRFKFHSDYIFAWESESLVNNAVLRVPTDSGTLAFMLKVIQRGINFNFWQPPHFNSAQRLKWIMKTILRDTGIEEWPWGSTGPHLLTSALRKSDEINRAMPKETFYYIEWTDHQRFLDQGALEISDFPQSAYAAHFWGSQLSKYLIQKYDGRIPPRSFLSRYL